MATTEWRYFERTYTGRDVSSFFRWRFSGDCDRLDIESAQWVPSDWDAVSRQIENGEVELDELTAAEFKERVRIYAASQSLRSPFEQPE